MTANGAAHAVALLVAIAGHDDADQERAQFVPADGRTETESHTTSD